MPTDPSEITNSLRDGKPFLTCPDDFDECELRAGHAGDHQRTTDAGVLTWSDPMDEPPTDDYEDDDDA